MAVLSVLELCELSQKGTVDADGNPIKMDAVTLSQYIRMSSVDVTKFVQPVHVGEILEMSAKVIYSDPKSGRVYLMIEMKTLDPIESEVTSAGTTIYEDTKRNVFHVTYEVSKDIKLKQVMPTNYEEQLLYLQGKRIIDSAWVMTI